MSPSGNIIKFALTGWTLFFAPLVFAQGFQILRNFGEPYDGYGGVNPRAGMVWNNV